jgi:hypothetical protein
MASMAADGLSRHAKDFGDGFGASHQGEIRGKV